MSGLMLIKIAVRYLPELIDLVKSLTEMTIRGIEDAQIRRSINKISKAFANPNRQEAARELNNIFREG